MHFSLNLEKISKHPSGAPERDVLHIEMMITAICKASQGETFPMFTPESQETRILQCFLAYHHHGALNQIRQLILAPGEFSC